MGIQPLIRLTTSTDFGSLLTGLGGWAAIAPSSIPVIVVIMFMLGWIYPKSAMKRAWEEADQWRTAYEKEREARTVAEQAAYKASTVAGGAVQVVRSIRAGAGGEHREDEVAVAEEQG